MRHRRSFTLALATLLTALPLAGPVLAQAPSEKAMEKPAEGQEVVTPSGLKYTDLKVGTGEEATAGKTVTIHFTGWLTNGTKFESSHDKNQPLTFKLGAGQAIEGWDKGVAGMKVGGKRKLVIPPGLGYGGKSVGGVIPPNSTLVFEVELLKVKNP
ncbi:MAG TPA: FKBP-type peptidyl-prolyl cis-trans isomerase [Thermoanaerobaculia bacterium]|jgi:FKBP-type peptidyl-prolyl cis-trans isomerase FkpA|nr:FKBP-type peptidyl-prolyl cis-trans isomerase [Thermoanaerobaculia bacterium]